MDEKKEIELTKNAVLDACQYAVQTNEYASGIGCADRGAECYCYCCKARIIKAMIAAGYRKADEVRKEMSGEIENLKSALDDAIHSFTRMETLYKIKRFKSETETAKKIFTELYHDVKAMGEDAEYIKEKAWKEYGVEVDE